MSINVAVDVVRHASLILVLRVPQEPGASRVLPGHRRPPAVRRRGRRRYLASFGMYDEFPATCTTRRYCPTLPSKAPLFPLPKMSAFCSHSPQYTDIPSDIQMTRPINIIYYRILFFPSSIFSVGLNSYSVRYTSVL